MDISSTRTPCVKTGRTMETPIFNVNLQHAEGLHPQFLVSHQ